MQIGKYNLENEVKAANAVAEVGAKDEKRLLAEYDKRGGLIKLGGVPVPLGTFWDFQKGEARKVALKGMPKLAGVKGKGKKGKKGK